VLLIIISDDIISIRHVMQQINRSHVAPWDFLPHEQIVVLSPDATEAVESFDADKVSWSVELRGEGLLIRQGLRARTALTAAAHPKEWVPGRVTHVLNIDHVLQAICGHVDCQDWSVALFQDAIPKRKKACWNYNVIGRIGNLARLD